MGRVLYALLFVATVGNAQQAGMSEAQIDSRLKVLSAELRCLVCQNQSLADSSAELAIDLRNQVREQIVAGKNDDQIKEYLVQRYGDFVLYRPPVKNSTYMLWAGPFALLLLGGLAMFIYVRRRSGAREEVSISSDQRAQARELLAPSTETGREEGGR